MPRSLSIRHDDPPGETVAVLRGGTMSTGSIVRSAQRTFAVYAVLGVSVEAVEEGSLRDACRSERISGYRMVRLSTFARVRAAGFALLATFERPHYTLVLPDLSEVTIARLDRCFDPPIANPGRLAGGSLKL